MKYLKLLLLCLLFPVAALADGWETQYKQIEQSIRQPKFADREFMVTKYGASPEASAADNQKAINKAIDACHKAGGGRVVVPAGTYNTGAITLKSNVNLEVQKRRNAPLRLPAGAIPHRAYTLGSGSTAGTSHLVYMPTKPPTWP